MSNLSSNLTERVLATIDYAGEIAKTGIEFTKEQAPLVVQEFLTYTFFEKSLMAITVALFSLILIIVSLKTWKIAWEFTKKCDCPAIVINVLLFIFSVVCIWHSVIPNALDATKIKMAPRVYLIEWAAKQVK